MMSRLSVMTSSPAYVWLNVVAYLCATLKLKEASLTAMATKAGGAQIVRFTREYATLDAEGNYRILLKGNNVTAQLHTLDDAGLYALNLANLNDYFSGEVGVHLVNLKQRGDSGECVLDVNSDSDREGRHG